MALRGPLIKKEKEMLSTILLSTTLGAFIGFICASVVFIPRLKQFENQLSEKSDAHEKLTYLRSRIRAFEYLAYKTEKGEAYYVVQDTYGKFRKMNLPSVK